MKNLIKFFMVLAVLCVVAACSQTFESVNNNIKSQEKAKGRLVMNVGSQSRTIMPEINENDIKSATLTANGDEIKSWSGADVISQLESDNSILLDTGIYDFEMTFCNENGDVILKGVIEKLEIVAGDNSLVFDMKVPATDNGNIAIGLSWETDDGISKIKAGLYHIATGEAVAGYEAEEITITGTQAEYAKNDVPTGQYIIKFEIYDVTDKLLNTLTDVIKVIGEMTTSDQKVLSKINTQYTITYDLAGGSWKSGFTPVTLRNANTGITLPTAENVKKTNYVLIGWYDENGDKVTQIPSDTAKDISVTAKWWYPINFVYVQGATITGAITADGYTTSEVFKDEKTVTVPDLYVCDHEVTQAEYEKYCSYGGKSPSSTYGDGNNYPAYWVSWYDALVYCNKRSIAEGLTPCYTISDSTDPDDWGTVPTGSGSTWYAAICDFEADGYRLPTEAEWEYAARGGNGLTGYQYTYAGSDTIGDVAWYTDNSSRKTHTVKGKKANGLGLYDMSGNVWEWCWDAHSGSYRVQCSGSWRKSADFCTVTGRDGDDAYDRIDHYGFRVVRTVNFIPLPLGYIAYSDGSVSVDYDNTKTPVGIVIGTTDGKATKIVSLTQTSAKWSTDHVYIENVKSATNGKANMEAIQAIEDWEEEYPAFKWCDDYTDASGNSQWYLPAKNELDILYKVKDYVDAAIDKITAGGGTATKLGTGTFWSSSQDNLNDAWSQRFSDGYQDDPYKSYTHSVRAVRAF